MTAWLQGPAVAAAAGVAGAGVLLLLHRLSPRPVRRVVATTMFWRAAAREQDRRVLGGRWARWGTFLLILSVLLLLAGGLTGWMWDSRGADGRHVVLVLDTGYTMATPSSGGKTRLDEAMELLTGDLGRLRGVRVSVLEAGSEPQLILGVGDPMEIGEDALRGLRPQQGPSARAAALRLARSLIGGDAGGNVVLYTDRELADGERPDGLADLRVHTVGAPSENAAILSAVFVPGGGSRGALNIRVGTWGSDPAAVEMVVGDERHRVPLQPEGQDIATAVFQDVEADGRQFTVRLTDGDAGPAADDIVRGRLPKLGKPAFQVSGIIPVELHAALTAIGAVVEAPTGAAISVIGPAADVAAPGKVAIRVSGDNRSVPAGVTVTAASADVEYGVGGPGADVRDAGGEPLLMAGHAVVGSMLERGATKSLILSDALFAEGATLVGKAHFFDWLRRACDDLAARRPVPSSVPLERRRADPLWESEHAVEVVGDRETSKLSRPRAGGASSESEVHTGARLFHPWEILLAMAVVAAVVEGWLYCARRIA